MALANQNLCPRQRQKIRISVSISPLINIPRLLLICWIDKKFCEGIYTYIILSEEMPVFSKSKVLQSGWHFRWHILDARLVLICHYFLWFLHYEIFYFFSKFDWSLSRYCSFINLSWCPFFLVTFLFVSNNGYYSGGSFLLHLSFYNSKLLTLIKCLIIYSNMPR